MKRNCLILLLSLSIFASCKKELTVNDPAFEVTVSSTTVRAGEEITFMFEGSTDVVTFYSGEKGSDYDFKNIERIYDASTSLSFYSAKYAGNNTNCASLKYSTDFNGVYEPAAIRQATWTDISDRFNIPPINGSSAVMEFSEEKDISDLFPNGTTPIYIGWFFTTNENSSRTRFQIIDFAVNGVVQDDPSLSGVKYSQSAAAFQMVKGEGFLIQDHATTTPRVTTTAIIWDGVFANTSYKEGWAVSTALYPASTINLGWDYGVGIKAVLDAPLKEYKTTYATPGTYKAVFVASNVNIHNRKEIIREIELTVLP